MNEKIGFHINPPEERSCAYCRKWNRYPPWDDGEESTWGKCTLEGAPRYMHETYYTRGCNHHSSYIAEQKDLTERERSKEQGQLSLF